MSCHWFKERECKVLVPTEEVHGALSNEEGGGTQVQVSTWSMPILKIRYEKPSYMAIKKALYGRQPGCFAFAFYFLALSVAREFLFCLFSEVFNKVPSFTHLDVLKLQVLHRVADSCMLLFTKIFFYFFGNSDWA